MFVTPTIFGVSQRVVATLVACAVVMASIGFYHTAQAANLTDVSNTLSSSEPSTLSSHTIAFTVPTGSTLDAADNFTITFPGAFTIDAGMAIGDFTVTVAGSGVTVDNFSEAGGVITLSLDTTANATEEVIVVIAGTEITNPAKVANGGIGDSYEIEINTTADVGKTRVVIIDTVEVTASVATVFDFVVTGLATSTTVNGEGTTGSTTPTEIAYGSLAAGVAEFLAQQLNVTTNAANGFVVTVEKDAPFQSSTGADIDDFVNGVQTDTPTAWAPPNGTLAFGENGWGHWGMVAIDGNLQGEGTNFTATDQFVSVADTPRAIFAHNGPTDGTTTGGNDASTDDIGQTMVGYKVEITPLQEAGDDYNTTLMYVATPTF